MLTKVYPISPVKSKLTVLFSFLYLILAVIKVPPSSISNNIEVTNQQTQANIKNQTSFPSSPIKQTSIPIESKTTIIYNLTDNTEKPERDTTISDIHK